MARNLFGRRDDGPTVMASETLDDWTAERLLQGALLPDDAPPGYGGVATLLEAARTEVRATTSAEADATVAAMLAAVRRRRVAVPPRRRVRAKMTAAASAGLLALSGGLASAGALPSAAQNHVSSVLANVGIEVPRTDGGHGVPRSGSHVPGTENHDADPAGGAGTTTNHGECVSQVAGEGGAQVSAVARSDCGKPPTAGGPPADHGTAGTARPDQVPPAEKPHPTPPPQSNSGGSPGNGSPGAGQDNAHNGTSQGNGYGQGGIPSPPGPGDSAHPVHESPPPSPAPRNGKP